MRNNLSIHFLVWMTYYKVIKLIIPTPFKLSLYNMHLEIYFSVVW